MPYGMGPSPESAYPSYPAAPASPSSAYSAPTPAPAPAQNPQDAGAERPATGFAPPA